MSQYKKFTKDVGIFGIATFLVGLEGFILIPILTKNLGAFDYGIWSQIKVTLALIGPLVFFGLNDALIRFLTGTKNEKKINVEVSTAALFLFISGIFFTLLIFIFSEQLSLVLLKTVAVAPFFKIASLLLFLRSVSGLFRAVFRFKQKYGLYSFSTVLLAAADIILVSFFLLKGMGLRGVLAGFISAQVITFVFTFILSKKFYSFVKPSFGSLKNYLSYGTPLIFIPLFHWIFQVGDQYILGYYHGGSVVGLYALAYSLSYVLRTLATPILTILQTSITAAWNQKDIKSFRTYFRYSYKYLFLILIPAGFGIISLSKPIILIISTEEFLLAAKILPILVIGILLFTFVHLSNMLLRIEKKTKAIRNIFLFLALCNIILNLILVPLYSLYGAAIATLITFIFAAVYSIYIIKKNKMALMPFFLAKSILASIVMSIFVIYARKMHISAVTKLIIIIPISVIIYFIIMYLLQSFKKEELVFLKNVLLKRGKTKIPKPL